VLIDRLTAGRKLFYGAMSRGSINLAEMMPYYQALCWYHHVHGKERLKRRAPLRVHVITDSQVTTTHGNAAAHGSATLPKVGHRALWMAMREFGNMGYAIQFHWAGRSDSSLNNLCDLVAALSRRAIRDMPEHAASATAVTQAFSDLTFRDPETGEPLSPYSFNPDTELPDDGNNSAPD
jgi:hypothetical protein